MLKTLVFSILLLVHPVHVSLMSVEYSEKQDVLNVFLKVFSDDFLLDYKLFSGDTSEIDLNRDSVAAQIVILKYLNEKVQILADGKMLEIKIMNFELSEDEIKIDMVFRNIRRSKSYTVRNRIMTDLHKDQSNLLIFRFGDYEEGIKLTPEKTEFNFRLK